MLTACDVYMYRRMVTMVMTSQCWIWDTKGEDCIDLNESCD